MHFYEIYDKWQGIIPLFGGMFGLLLAYKVIPRNPKNPEKMELWHKKFGKMMKVLSPILIAFGVISLMGFLQPDKKPTREELLKNVKIIRQQVGVANTNGWYPAKSTNGGYSVIFPAPFGEVESPPAENDRVRIYSYVMASALPGGKFTAIFMKYEGGIPDPVTYKNEMLERIKKISGVTSSEVLDYEGHPLVEMTMKNENFEGISNTIITSEGVYQLTTEFQELNQNNINLARQFLGSFKIIDS